MINNLKVENFKAVPYLETSLLCKAHPDGFQFSSEKPNVIVGLNGAGKSALLQTLALRTLSFYIGESAFDDQYVLSNEARTFWSDEGASWRHEYAFLSGLTCETDDAPALYYRPGHIPGNDNSIGASMMCGYSKQARSYADLVDNKSSGQQSRALLGKLVNALTGDASEMRYQYVNWRAGKERKDLERSKFHVCDFEYQFEILKKQFDTPTPDARPLILMDEPEQSLDARAEALLWGQIAKADSSRVQVIVATHSWYPLFHPETFNIIEAVPGYLQEVRALM